MMRYTISTEGLHCGHCEAAVEAALLRVFGIDDADADHEANIVVVSARHAVDSEALTSAIEGAGAYRVLSITAEQHR